MVVRFCPDLNLGYHRSQHKSEDVPPAALDDELDEDVDIIPSIEVPEDQEDSEDEIYDLEVEDLEDQDELEDEVFGYYGYEELSEEEEITGDDGNMGPEDGEEPFNYDVALLDEEGYGLL